MEEVEVKLGVPPEALASLEADLQRRGGRRSRLRAHYFDTAGGLLAGNGLSLRLRKEDDRWVQTLKAATDGTVERLEHNVELQVAGDAVPIVDPVRHDGSEAGLVLNAVLDASGRTEALVEVHAADVRRCALEVAVEDAWMEVALDRGTVTAGAASAPVCELEIELKSGRPAAIFELARACVAFGGLWVMTASKAQRGMALARGEGPGAALHAETPSLQEGMGGGALVRAVLQSCLKQVLANATAVAAGSADEHHVHQLRVGLRRLRTALRELGGLAPGLDPAWEAPLAQTFGLLGEFRDDESVAAAVRPLLEAAEAPLLAWRGASGRVEPADAVRLAAFQTALLDLLAFVTQPDGGDGEEGAPAQRSREHVVARLDKLHKQVVREGKRFEALAEADQHRVRKRLKRLRYLAEFVETLHGGKRFDRYVERLRPAQDALGAHNDALVALARFRRQAQEDPRALFAVGYLEAHRASTARACRRALETVGGAKRFWRD